MKKNSYLLPIICILHCIAIPLQSISKVFVDGDTGSPLNIMADIDEEISILLATERAELPLPGELLYEITDLSGHQFNSANGATSEIVDAEDELDFGKKFIIDVKMAGTNAWEPQLQSPVNQIAVNNGDIILYIFTIRKTEPAQNGESGQAAFFSQRATSPWTGLGSLSLTLADSWRKYYVIAKATEDFAVGEMRSTFHLGFMQQKIEVGGMIALNMGSAVNVDDLPQNDIFYVGMEEDADWRAEAAARIEEHRKSDLNIKVLDKDGNPVESAEITLEMKKHYYGFGSFISNTLIEEGSDGDKYRQSFKELFNCATTPFYMGGNGDNWGWYSSLQVKNEYHAFAEWFQENKIPAKGHVLVWPSWQWMPSFFEDIADDPIGLHDAIDDHLEELVPVGKRYGLYQWDVVNEPFINHDVMDILGEEIIVEWFERVRELDAKPRLIMNEYNIIQGGGRTDFQNNFIRLIEYLKDEGAPLDGIGMQCHFDENLTGIPDVLRILDQFEAVDLPIQITEFDVDTRDVEIQAAYLKDFYTAVFSHPATEKIVMWGFYEPVMWKPNGALIGNGWLKKPNYYAYKDLVLNEWWTNESGSTDSNGDITVRGFNANYDLTVVTPDTTYLINFNMVEDSEIKIKGAEIMKPTVEIEEASVVSSLSLSGYPNPFDLETMIEYTITEPSMLNVRIFNSTGGLIRTFTLDHSVPGTYNVVLDGDELDPGMYLCVIDAVNTKAESSSMVLIKGDI